MASEDTAPSSSSSSSSSSSVTVLRSARAYRECMQSAAERNALVVVSFVAAWAPPSVAMQPRVRELARRRAERACVFVEVDVDECDDVAAHERVSALPCYLLVWRQQRVTELIGASSTTLERIVDEELDYYAGGDDADADADADAGADDDADVGADAGAAEKPQPH